MFIPSSSVARAKLFSELLWNIMIKAGQVGDTVRYCRWVVHPTNNTVMVEIPDNITAPVLNADTAPLESFLAPLVASGKITAQDIANSKAVVVSNAGKRIAVSSILPPFFVNAAQTFEQLSAAGWFPDPSASLPMKTAPTK